MAIIEDIFAQLKAAHKAGKRIEVLSRSSKKWELLKDPSWNVAITSYRIHPDDVEPEQLKTLIKLK